MLPLRRHTIGRSAAPGRIAIVIPANNEEVCIAATVGSIRAQVDDRATIIVVADNCDDATAERAAAAGAVVWERVDPSHRAKGYALNFALERMAETPPDVVIVIDADCTVGPECIETLAELACRYQRPVQAAYVMHAPEPGDDLFCTSAFAVFIKNVARPRGLQRIGLPCMLNGSGMAFPWKALATVRFVDQHITEDMRMSGELAKAGLAPIPCMEVGVASQLPSTRTAFISQRTRWEHGHMATMLRVMPPLIFAFIQRPRLQIVGLLMELSVPPLSLMVFSAGISGVVLAGVSYGVDSWWPALIYFAAAIGAALGLMTVWFRHGRSILSPRQALQIPRYALTKAPMYLRFVTRRQRAWVRTERRSPAVGEQWTQDSPRPHSPMPSRSAPTTDKR